MALMRLRAASAYGLITSWIGPSDCVLAGRGGKPAAGVNIIVASTGGT